MSIDFVVRRQTVLARIRAAEQRFQRLPGAVRLLAVSKIQPTAAIVALAAAGQSCLGKIMSRKRSTKSPNWRRCAWNGT